MRSATAGSVHARKIEGRRGTRPHTTWGHVALSFEAPSLRGAPEAQVESEAEGLLGEASSWFPRALRVVVAILDASLLLTKSQKETGGWLIPLQEASDSTYYPWGSPTHVRSGWRKSNG